MIELKHGRLKAEILEPYREYTGVRFDCMGFIKQIYYSGNPLFCDYYENKFIGAGLCNEFGITKTIGYGENEYFIKIGVGLLKCDNQAYSFMKAYPIKPLQYSVDRESDDMICFCSESRCGAYGVRYKKKISLGDNLDITYTIENIGEKDIDTDEYAHNFIRLKSRVCEIKSPVADDTEQLIPALGGVLTISDKENSAFICRYKPKYSQNFFWSISNGEFTIRENSGFDANDFSVWKSNDITAPEINCDIRIKPGRTKTWTRQYVFSQAQGG